jgi:hypothetical protein
MAFNNPTIAQFKNQFQRDFPFGSDPNTSILDFDIQTAQNMTNMNMNQGLFSDQVGYNIAYNLLTAHYLVLNIRASTQGLSGQFNFLQASKGVGPVNESFSIPQRILDNPLWSMYTKTNYGAQYIQLLLPLLSGQIYSVHGTTRA